MIANLLARLLLPRLRAVNPRTLRRMKSELDAFNARTSQWRAPAVSAEPNPSN
jgi:hypothetical protein